MSKGQLLGYWKCFGAGHWCIPVVPATWETEAGVLLEFRVWDQPEQHSETLSQKKKKKKVLELVGGDLVRHCASTRLHSVICSKIVKFMTVLCGI
jgi:hypothetical protein